VKKIAWMPILVIFLPIIPAKAAPNYVFPVSGCKYTYARSHHNYPATDILAKIGCDFVAPTSGVIDEVNRVDRFTWKTNLGADRGGLSVSMIGNDGVRYYGSHLSFIPENVAPGLQVSAGDVIGKTGNSGDAKGTAPHVHFGISWPTPKGIWWVRRGELYPWKYLDGWKAGKDLNPAKAVAALEKKVGTVPVHTGY
jgi:murein DD-endopeptidase MepM/ murein hydrolase activator NlpD